MGLVRFEGGLADGLRYDYQPDPFEHWPTRRRRGQPRTKPRRRRTGDRLTVKILTIRPDGSRDLQWDTYRPHREGDVTVYRLITPTTDAQSLTGMGWEGYRRPER